MEKAVLLIVTITAVGIVESGLDVIAGQTEDFAGVLELIEAEDNLQQN